MKKKVIITGSSGFIGSNLTQFLKQKGYFIIGVDIRKPSKEYKKYLDNFYLVDLRNQSATQACIRNTDELYMLAADMGGVGYLSTHNAQVGIHNGLINLNTISSAEKNGIKKIFFASSACVYPTFLQLKPFASSLSEEQAIPSSPDQLYGWEKLYMEQLLMAYLQEKKIDIKIGRFFAIYGPGGAYDGEKTKSIQALCNKVINSKNNSTIEVWGDGKQTRTYCYISDCCEAIYTFMQSHYNGILNIGTTEEITITQLTKLIISVSQKKIKIRFLSNSPQGVRGRCPDITKIQKMLAWKPKINLEDGVSRTYQWIEKKLKRH